MMISRKESIGVLSHSVVREGILCYESENFVVFCPIISKIDLDLEIEDL